MTVTARSAGKLKVEIKAGPHTMIADEPVEKGGDDMGPCAHDILLASLASCTIITLHLYANRKGWALESVEVSLNSERVLAKHCEDSESDPNDKVDIIYLDLQLNGDLSEEERERLLAIANRCPVHRTLTSETKIRTNLTDNLAKLSSLREI